MKTKSRRARFACRSVVLALASMLVAGAAAAKVVAGVDLPGTISVAGQALALASCGVRDTLWIEHYVAALYLRPGEPATAAMLDAGEPKAIVLHVVRGASLPEQIPQAWREPLRQELERDPLARVRAAYGALGNGDRVRVTYAPADGVSMAVDGREVVAAPGHDLIGSMLRTWAEGDPLSGKLQRLLLEHPCRS